MQRARQHIPSFMGAYIPPCGDVAGGVVIRVGDKATVCASERFAVPYSDMQTFGTSLGGVRRRYGNDIHTRKFTLVFKETAELGERPRIGSPSECLVALLFVGSFANIGAFVELGSTPREAFAALIDKVSGRGTWESNPYVVVYGFELVK